MEHVLGLACPECDARFEPAARRAGCPNHDDHRPLRVRYDFEALRDYFQPPVDGPVDLWDYRALLPVDSGTAPVTLGEGGTPLVASPTLGRELDVDLSLKLESANPTGSTKDRGTSVLVTGARARGASVVTCASTGNAAASTAAYAARAGLSCCLFVPADVPETKAVQPLVAGADVFAVDGTYDDAAACCRRIVAGRDWWDRSAGRSPLIESGARTLGFELADGLETVPDWIVVPMGNGGTLAGLWRGFVDYERLGLVDRVPRLLGVQAAGASPIHDDFTGSPTAGGGTCADGIDVGEPHHRRGAIASLEESDGASVAVTDDEIRRAIERLGRSEGVFAEPASAAGVAGLVSARERGIVDAGERVVVVVTGDGLKDAGPAIAATDDPIPVGRDSDVERVVDGYE